MKTLSFYYVNIGDFYRKYIKWGANDFKNTGEQYFAKCYC